MDWPKARAILLVAFLMVNLVLAFSIWGPVGSIAGVSEVSLQQQERDIRTTLLERGIDLRVPLPKTPGPMRFLHVEYQPTLDFSVLTGEAFSRAFERRIDHWFSTGERVAYPRLDSETQAIIYEPNATGPAARNLKLDNPGQVQQAVDAYLRSESLMPPGAHFFGSYQLAESGQLILEYVPIFEGNPVFSGYVKVAVSTRGIETVTHLWVQPREYKNVPAKAVRPAAEALLRLAGHLEQNTNTRRSIVDIRLGYYAGRILTASPAGDIQGWDTVPAWRIRLDNGEIYYLNAFNGELES